MEELIRLINSSLINDARTDVFLYPFPDNFLYYDVKIDPEQTSFLVDNKQVIKLRLLLQPSKNQSFNAACCINFADGNKMVRTVCPDKLNQLHNCFIRHCSNNIQPFVRMTSQSLPWGFYSMRHHYSQQSADPFLYYTKLHEKIINSIEILIDENHFEGLNIIDAGCGDGQLLKKIESRLGAKLNKGCNFLGFDFNSKNIQACLHEYQGACVFLQGDMLKIQHIIQGAFLGGYLNPEWPIVLTLSGTLTRLVLDNGFQAGNVLMQAAAKSVDYLIGGGVGEPLITRGMLKQIGYKALSLNSEMSVHNFFCCQLISKKESLSRRLAKLDKANCLDLSLCPEADIVLKMAEASLRDDSNIDLSFVPVTEELIQTLDQITQRHQDLSLIFCHYDIEQAKKLIQSFFLRAKVSITINSQDGVLLSSSRFFDRLRSNSACFVSGGTLINPFILNYIAEKIPYKRRGRPNWIKQQEELLDEIANSVKIVLDRDDDEIPIVRLPEEGAVFRTILESKLSVWKSDIFGGNLTKLDGLIAFYRYGMTIIPHGEFFGSPEEIGSLEDEILLYHHLASAHSEEFPRQAMRMLSYWAIDTKTAFQSLKRKAAMVFVDKLFTHERDDSLQRYSM
ncbi:MULTISPECIES: methyltransferase domain-containing protein [unclassified Legionella]|uniref:methyltransferase domain-containing protein n=1 Tax=unclassified Legionella TaxID=2622702 RepID=UPI0010560C85|nr:MULTISPECIES: class I SAM-dependent methyltransferase [unclassified Legionella]MDI9819136.1 class I SAM-dependent methyltransferase [Legionella sp. PL877]